MLLFKLQEKTLPSLKRCWEGAVEAYWARLNAFAAHINDACDIEGIHPQAESFFLLHGKRMDPIGSNYVCARVTWIQFLCLLDPIFWRGSLVDPILFRE